MSFRSMLFPCPAPAAPCRTVTAFCYYHILGLNLHRAPIPEEEPLDPLPGEEPSPDEEELPPHPNPSINAAQDLLVTVSKSMVGSCCTQVRTFH